LLSASPAGGDRALFGGNFTSGAGLDFPDFKRIRIRHPKPDLKGWDERRIDIETAFTSGACSADVPLELGDQVEIPETDHILSARWDGLDPQTLETLNKYLTHRLL